MRAIDTNLIVRLLVDEQSPQGERARAVVAEGAIFVATTVLLESEWVLRSAYGFGKAEIATALRKLAGLPNVRLEDPGLSARALDWSSREWNSPMRFISAARKAAPPS